MPMTCPGRLVTAAMRVMLMLLVLVARMQFAGAFASRSRKILSFRSTFSVAASTTSSALFTPAAMSVAVVMFFRVAAFCSSLSPPLATWRSRFLAMVARALSRLGWAMSMRVTRWPLWAKTWAMPLPIWPAPITEMFMVVNCVWAAR